MHAASSGVALNIAPDTGQKRDMWGILLHSSLGITVPGISLCTMT